MGLTLKRSAFGALVLAAVLLPLRKPATVIVPATDQSRSERLESLMYVRFAAHLAWTAFDLQDSAKALIAKLPPANGRPTISWRGFAVPVRNASADSVINQLWPHLGSTNEFVRTSILAYNQQQYRSPAYSGTMITSHDGLTDCVAIAPARSYPGIEPVVWQDDLASALAPCALLATFGAPGAEVGRWLNDTRYTSARSNNWITPSPSQYSDGSLRYTNDPWMRWSNSRRDFWPLDDNFTSFMARVGVFEFAMLMRPTYEFGVAGIRCITGVEKDCVDGVLHSALTFPPADEMPSELTVSGWRRLSDSTTVGTVRPASGGFVAAMITEFGREKFQKFWSSDQPFEAAFQSAFGISLGAWTAQWAAREWAGSYEAKHGNPEILLGVTLKPSWFPLLIGWSAFAVAIAASVARRRTA